MWSTIRVVVIGIVALTACSPSTSGGSDARSQSGQAPQGQVASSGAPKTITLAIDEELKNLWDPITNGGGTGAREVADVINQHLVAITADGSPTPRLLAELPSFDKGTWRVLPDGKMETTYKLRADAYWHDGTPFTADDVVFSYQVNADKEVPNADQDAVRLIDRMEVVDPHTLLVSWKESYPFADRMEHRDLYLLPKHILDQSYTQGAKEAFLNQPFFSTDFVGLGPFRIARWESGSHMDLTAFDQYFLGRPKLDGIRLQFISDPNTMLANLRARTVQVMTTLGARGDFEAMNELKRDWESSGYGTVIMDPISYRFVEPQQYHNPSPQDLTNPTVRKAMLLALDREALARRAFGDAGIVADSWVSPTFASYQRLKDSIVHYPHDTRQATQLMADAGWRPGADGVLEKDGQKFTLTMRDQDGEAEALVIASFWKEIGIVGNYERKSVEALRDREDRATFSGVDLVSNPMGIAAVTRRSDTSNIPNAQNRWTGSNRGGYSNPAWDELEVRLLSSLQEDARTDVERQLLRMASTELPLLPTYFRYDLVPVGAGLKGPVPNTGVAHRGFILHTWNVHEWALP
ncbi:MAG: peptide/nickel transport system substrate-binding protein [Chloroflexota bacterium]|jgi:peptide/nickel transport system substrate-binding protein|nr:peptide/nickel transport system substrate-binding protein [Chloroflexota bacterium]